ncbi:xanthine dehydrogenase family protein molybdopterin-binding subunit [Roseobacter sinensis]|uniref:Molybdopterin-dependent oxidoreductase n=1 Tax=Roseobacter sinensis TaxID=2931391 RepID=A0ABT3BEP3_9RHOB|nr:molybdopterin cofactor-binding domain-containing protein [Roseobacter sp. WL0113]MCV3272051.1 molybdopterin-dependent oxidoreductase [Roseobacter sp. WL0113]
MSRLGTLTRRGLMIGAAAVAGGVAFGTYTVLTPHANPLARDLGPGAASFNPYIRITQDRITLIVPHVDLGQGAASLQAALIAEELDVEFGQFELEQAAPDPAYYNTAMADEAVPFMSTDTGFPAEAARAAIGAGIKLAGVQVTGGSTAVPDSFEKLRLAGAVARETLKAAASAETGYGVATLRTEEAAVILPDGSRRAYTELAATAATLDPVTDVTLRMSDAWRFIGQPMQRWDIVAKSTGQQRYGIDMEIDGMVRAAVRCNPRKGGALLGYDASAAEAMRGVQRVVPVTGGVAVIAENTWYAFQALDAITYDWGPAPYPASQDEHWAALEAAFTPDALDRVWRDDGDAEAAVSERSDLTVEYRAPYLAHQPLEPLNAIVRVTEDRADVWVAHQMVRFVQQRVAERCGLGAEQVFVHNQFAGGSFGHRLEFDLIDRATEIALQMPGTPVKLIFSREEDFAQDYPRQIGMARVRGRVENGRVRALDLQIATPSAVRSQMGRVGLPVPGPDPQIAAGAWNLPYAIPDFRVSAYAVPGLAPTSSWRSVGASTAGFFAEAALDELIHAAGADPMAERLRLVTDPVARGVLEAVAEMSDWGRTVAPGQGRGLAFVTSFGVPVAEVIDVTQTPEGLRIDRVYVAADVGRIIDPVNFEAQVQGGVIWALGHAINSEITYADGQAEQMNYYDGEGMRLSQTPEILVRGLETQAKIRGIGEPPVPPAAPALANAVFAATGQRLREMPFNRHIAFV